MRDQPDFFELYKNDPENFEKFRKKYMQEEIIRLAKGDKQKEWKLRKIQNKIDKELSKYKDPIAKYNKMIELFWKGFEEFRSILTKNEHQQ